MRFVFEDCEIDIDRFEFRRAGQLVHLEPQVYEVLAFLVSNHERAVARDELIEHVWPGGYISDAALSSRLMAARKAIGDTGREQRLIRTIHGRGFRFVGEVSRPAMSLVAETAPPGGRPHEADVNASDDLATPVIQYAHASDGTSIAFSVTGEGFPILRSLGWFTHLEREMQWPAGRRFWQRLGANRTLVRYDGRGMGLSDAVDHFSPEFRLHDLEAVADAAGLERFALLGMSEGVHTAVHYAARYPERVSHLICYAFGPSVDERERAEWQHTWQMLFPLIREGWGRDVPVFRRLFAELFLGPDASREDIDYFIEMQRASTTPARAVHHLASLVEDGVAESAARISVPTLVLHRRDDMLIPFARGRKLASLIPGARFVPLEGANHWLLYDDPGAPIFVSMINDFIEKHPV